MTEPDQAKTEQPICAGDWVRLTSKRDSFAAFFPAGTIARTLCRHLETWALAPLVPVSGMATFQAAVQDLERWVPQIGEYVCHAAEPDVVGIVSRVTSDYVEFRSRQGIQARGSLSYIRPAARPVGETEGGDVPAPVAALATPAVDPYVAHEQRLAALAGSEIEAYSEWRRHQEFLRLIRYRQGLARSPWDWEPPEDFEVL